ncbi:MAG: RDD family protein [Oligoflexia bacterium]|nr:RDD family protein [Oligoflexia bacterium]
MISRFIAYTIDIVLVSILYVVISTFFLNSDFYNKHLFNKAEINSYLTKYESYIEKYGKKYIAEMKALNTTLPIENASKDLTIKSYITMNINMWLLFFGYFIFPVYFFSGTVGKIITGMRIVNVDRIKLSFFQVILRETIWKTVSFVTVIGLLIAVVNKRNRTLHDFFSGTCVIKK